MTENPKALARWWQNAVRYAESEDAEGILGHTGDPGGDRYGPADAERYALLQKNAYGERVFVFCESRGSLEDTLEEYIDETDWWIAGVYDLEADRELSYAVRVSLED